MQATVYYKSKKPESPCWIPCIVLIVTCVHSLWYVYPSATAYVKSTASVTGLLNAMIAINLKMSVHFKCYPWKVASWRVVDIQFYWGISIDSNTVSGSCDNRVFLKVVISCQIMADHVLRPFKKSSSACFNWLQNLSENIKSPSCW